MRKPHTGSACCSTRFPRTRPSRIVASRTLGREAMKTIGMLGGMSWESSAVYYRILNREMQKRLGGIHSAKTLMHSCDFAEMAALQGAGRWDEAHDQMSTI